MFILLDLAILAVLALCAWRGAVKGLILTLCSLLAVIVAFAGAYWISNQFCEPVGEFIKPYLSSYVDALVDNALGTLPDTGGSGAIPSFQIPGGAGNEITSTIQLSLEELVALLRQSELLAGLTDSISQAVEEGALTVVTTAADAVASHLALLIARSALFFLSFFLLLVLWWLLSHALDLAFKLPVLRTLNGAGGLILGLLKGAIIILVACWAVRFLELIPTELTRQTWLFSRFMNFQII